MTKAQPSSGADGGRSSRGVFRRLLPSAAAPPAPSSPQHDAGDNKKDETLEYGLRKASLTRRVSIQASMDPSRPVGVTKRNSTLSVLPHTRGGPGCGGRPMTSPHATHAMVVQLQEYHDRLERALDSTYQFALKPPPTLRPQSSSDQGNTTTASPQRNGTGRGYCRQRILQSSRTSFQSPRGDNTAPPPAFSTPVGIKDPVLPHTGDVHVSFHQAAPRTSAFLYADNEDSARRMRMLDAMASSSSSSNATSSGSSCDSSSIVPVKDHFALGPGQYDLPTEKPSGASAAAKFSPSDRFHEDYSTDRPGPGQYITSETLVSPRPAAAIFSQVPRQMDVATPTANVVSSYYYVPESAFGGTTKTAHQLGWSRTARFKNQEGRHRRNVLKPHHPNQSATPATDFIAKNVREIQQAAAKYKLGNGPKKTNQYDDDDKNHVVAPSSSSSSSVSAGQLVVTRSGSSSSSSSAVQKNQLVHGRTTRATFPSSSTVRVQARCFHAALTSPRNRSELRCESWLTVACIASVQMKLIRFHRLVTMLKRVHVLQDHTRKLVTFTAWKTLDANHNRGYATCLILRNLLRYRIWYRIKKKRAHASILRQFLSGLSFDVRFALAMKRIKRKIQLIQRWWRHMQLMVKAREEALYHKWITVENRMRLEYINQMPHLQRIFQPPAGTTAAAGSSSNSNSEMQLHKLLNLPDQRKWFTAKFVLSSDGSMRGYALDNNEVVVEVKHFRCHFHDTASRNGGGSGGGSGTTSSSGDEKDASININLNAYSSYTNAAWKPFLMLFRHGTFRFVLVTSLSPLPTEIHSWKDKLERLMVNPNPTSAFMASFASRDPAGSSLSLASSSGGSFSVNNSSSFSDSSFFGSVSDLVEVSMQSGILAHHGSISESIHSSTNNQPLHRNPSTRGKFQQRVQSIRQRNKSGLSVVDGPLHYYVVDLLKDFPKVPHAIIWTTIREKLRDKRRAFRAEIYRYKLEMFHYHQHQEHVKHMHVLEKCRDFFTLEKPRRPHFRSLISNRKMEALIRQTMEQVKTTTPSNPRLLLDSTKI